MAHDVFISYSTRDKAIADAVCAFLEGRKIRCWIAPRDVPPGADWAAALIDAIDASRAFVLVFSDGANRSKQVLSEVGEAFDREIPILPLRVEDAELSRQMRYYIRSIHWLDALTPPLEKHLGNLAERVHGLLRTRRTEGAAGATRPLDQSAENQGAGGEGTPLPGTASGLPIATPENLAGLLALAAPPQRIWWEKGGLELCLVPAGEFLMGSVHDDQSARGEERPQHRLYLSAFYVGRTPVTQAQYARFVQATGRAVPFRADAWAKPYNWNERRTAPPKAKQDHPVVLVSWHDARAYCRWAGLRLPTEAEWEKAARGAGGCIYPWGDTWDPRKCNTKEGDRGATTPVGHYSPRGDSPYGCADMAGNVWEWTSSLWGKELLAPQFMYPYSPRDGREHLQAGDAVLRVSRGGAFDSNGWFARCAFRGWSYPNLSNRDYGFRVVVTSGIPCP